MHKKKFWSENATKQRQQWSLILLYIQHWNKIVSENTIKDRYKFLIVLPIVLEYIIILQHKKKLVMTLWEVHKFPKI